jgi:hypothetical protein
MGDSNRCGGDIQLRVEWHWGSDSSVVNDPLEEKAALNYTKVYPKVPGQCS